MYFRSSIFNVMEFALCVASLVAYVEVIVRTNVEVSPTVAAAVCVGW